MMDEFVLKPGLKAVVETEVEYGNTAASLGSGNIEVFATPAMIALMEKAAMTAVAPHLSEGLSTVGSLLDVAHVAATPIGMKVRAEAQLAAVEGRKLTFRVEAFDEKEKIGEGVHERFVINVNKFLNKVTGKLNGR